MAPLYWLSFSILLCLSYGHHIIAKWVDRPMSAGKNLVLYGVSIGGTLGQPLTITPGSEIASPHFQFMYDGSHNKAKDEDKVREFAFIASAGQATAIAADSVKFKKHLKASGKKSKSSSKTYTLAEFANMIAAGKVQYKAGVGHHYQILSAAHVNWGAVDVTIHSLFDTNKPKLAEAFQEFAATEYSEENLNFYRSIVGMQEMTGEDDQKQKMTNIYNDFNLEAGDFVNLGAIMVRPIKEAYQRDPQWTKANGDYIGTGLDANGADINNHPWTTVKGKAVNLMGDTWSRFVKSAGYRKWVRTTPGEYQLRYNADFQSTIHSDEEDAKESMDNEMDDDDDEYANDFDAELTLAFVRGYKAALDAKEEKEYGAGLLRKKYRY